MGKRLFVGNLAWATTDQDLVDFFGAGAVSAKVIMDRETGRSRGFAFVETESDAEADRIVREFGGAILDGRELRINEAEDRRPSAPRTGGTPRQIATPPTESRGRNRRRGRDDRDDDRW